MKEAKKMLVTPELSRQISEVLPQLQQSVKDKLQKIPVQEPTGLRTEILLSIGDISLLIKKVKESMEVETHG